RYQQNLTEAQIRSQGLSLAGVLSRLSYEQLTSPKSGMGPIQVVYQSQRTDEFAYATVTDRAGRPALAAASPGIVVPPATLPVTPGDVAGERFTQLPGSGKPVIEFYAPLWSEGQVAGHIRLGYYQPSGMVPLAQVPLLASVAFPVFLLTPFFYLLLKREITPLKEASRELQDQIEDGRFKQLEVKVSGEFGDFIQRFNFFMERAQARIDELESIKSKAEVSQKMLSYKRERVEAVLQAHPDMFLVLDETGTPAIVSDKLLGLLNLSRKSVIEQRPSAWCKDPNVTEFLHRCGDTNSPGYISATMVFTPESAPDRTIEVSAYPLFSPKDKAIVLGTLVIFRDTTESIVVKRGQGEFVAHIAHELKTPLNVLATYSEALQEEEGKDESFRIEAYNVIHDEVERLSGLISNLLSITQIEMGNMVIDRQRVRIGDLLEDALENVARSDRKRGIDFQLNIQSDLPALALDKNLFRVAINNLLTNAIKYSKEDGAVVISAEWHDDSVFIRVKDSGVGIAPEDQSRIFEKFYRSEAEEVRSMPGHGLGLALAHEIIALHQGDILVDSTPGEGTEFTIVLGKRSGAILQGLSN
ncbi:MAG TPA: HAMP domain-containing sensor histidine kinase, partial [Gammaproteobacteria bacterium]|nr:HAMP domain-containing sensor histidine kinase [Gammaproteobacteria bacterium]